MYGVAQYNVEPKVKHTDPGSQARLQPGTVATDTLVAPTSEDDIELNKQRVRVEAERVQAKLLSSVDTSSEVILRFDFMNNHDTRVGFSMFMLHQPLNLSTGYLQADLDLA